MKDKLIKGFGGVLFYVLAMGCCILVGAMVYLTASNLFPVPEGLPTSLPTRGPSPTPTVTPTPTPAPFPIGVRNRTGDDTVGDRIAAFLSDAGYNVESVSSSSPLTAFGGPMKSVRVWVREFYGQKRRLAPDVCRVLDVVCQVWIGDPVDVDVLLEIGSIRDWHAWLAEHGY